MKRIRRRRKEGSHPSIIYWAHPRSTLEGRGGGRERGERN